MTYLATKDFMLEVAKGDVQGHSLVNKFGGKITIGDGDEEAVWDGAGDYTWPDWAQITYLSQTTGQPNIAGEAVEIQGLDFDCNPVTQIAYLHPTDTTTPVELDTPLFRVFRMKLLAEYKNIWPIRAHNTAETVDYAIIDTNNQQTLMAVYTVPAGKTAYMTNYYCDYVRESVKDPDSIEYRLWTRDIVAYDGFHLKHKKGIPKQAGGFQHFFKPYFKINEKHDIMITAQPDGADAEVHAGFDLILVDD